MESHVNEVAEQVESATLDGRYQIAWQAVNRLSGRKAQKMYKIKGFNTIKASLNGWKTYFEKLLRSNDEGDNDNFVPQAIVNDELLINDKPIKLSKMNNALKSLKTGNSVGFDAVPGILLRSGGVNDIILPLMNHTLAIGNSPQAWTASTIVPIPKSGDLSMMTNYRGISLMSVTAKVYSRMLLNRIRPDIESHLRKEQNGFRPGRAKHKNLPCVLSFIDFKKAFDSINRDSVFKTFRAYGIPSKIVNAAHALDINTIVTIRTDEGLTDDFRPCKGVLQGDVLAPYLFIIILDYAMRQSVQPKDGVTLQRRTGSRRPAQKISDLAFDDDIVTLADSKTAAEEVLNRISTRAH